MQDEGRIGPLSYDVDPLAGDTDPDRPILVGGLASVALGVALVILGWFSFAWIANPKVISRGYPLAIVVIAVALAVWTSRGLRARPRRNAILVVTAISLFAALLANRALGSIKEAMPQVRRAIDAVHVPAGFWLVDEQSHGDRFCHHGCPTVVRRYAAPPADPDPVSTFVVAMEEDGWRPPAEVPPALATIAYKGNMSVQLGEKAPHVVEITVQRDQ